MSEKLQEEGIRARMWHSSALHLSSLPFPLFFSSAPPPSDLYFFHLLNFSSLTSPADSLSLCGGRSVYWSPRFTFSCSATLLGKRSSPSQHAHGYQCQGRRVIALLGLHTDSHLRAGVCDRLLGLCWIQGHGVLWWVGLRLG